MGGRTRTTWTKGQGGKPKGAKEKFPRSAKVAVTGLLERLGTNVALIEGVFRKGLNARAPSSFPYLKLLIEQHLGAPDQSVAFDLARKVIDEIHPGPSQAQLIAGSSQTKLITAAEPNDHHDR